MTSLPFFLYLLSLPEVPAAYSNVKSDNYMPNQQFLLPNPGSPTLSDLHHYKLTGSLPSGNLGADTQAAVDAYREQGKFDSTTRRK